MEIASLEDLVPGNHLVRKLDEAIDMSFIYEEVKELYSDFGRESIDPVVLIKIAMIQYIFGIPSMRKIIREIEVNFAYRWYPVSYTHLDVYKRQIPYSFCSLSYGWKKRSFP